MRIEITKPGRSKPIEMSSQVNFGLTARITVPDGAVSKFGLVYTLDGTDWEYHPDVPMGQQDSVTAFFGLLGPVKAIALDVEEHAGAPLILTSLQTGERLSERTAL